MHSLSGISFFIRYPKVTILCSMSRPDQLADGSTYFAFERQFIPVLPTNYHTRPEVGYGGGLAGCHRHEAKYWHSRYSTVSANTQSASQPHSCFLFAYPKFLPRSTRLIHLIFHLGEQFVELRKSNLPEEKAVCLNIEVEELPKANWIRRSQSDCNVACAAL